MIPSARYFNLEFELFNSKSAPNELIFVAAQGKLEMSNFCFFEPAISR